MNKPSNSYDICIIGAGLAGALVAYELSRRGLKVALLEAGPLHKLSDRPRQMQDRLKDFSLNPWAPDTKRDHFTIGGEVNYDLNDLRVKAVGGSTLHWGGLALRLHESDFRMKSLYGIGEDWPISYTEIEPYYGRAEYALGVAGIADNPFSSPRSTDYLLPEFPFSHTDSIFKRGCDKLNIKMHHNPWARNSKPYQGRPACLAFATCGTHRICPISAQYTAETHVQMAIQTTNTTLITQANVYKIETNAAGKVISVLYSTQDKKSHEITAKQFLLTAHAVESARLLLLSKSEHFPQGLANSSGLVGKYFMEHLGVHGFGKIKEKVYPYRIGFHTAESHQFCNPSNRDSLSGIKLGFLNNDGQRPYQIARQSSLWGDELAKEVQDKYGHHIGIYAQIEQLPDIRNTIDLDPIETDYIGNAVPRVTLSIGSYERHSLSEAKILVAKILAASGAEQIEFSDFYSFDAHHMGTCRMGNDPNSSVVNPLLRAHDVDNLYIVGSSVFVTGGVLQPSLTIAALAIRTAEHVASVFR
ncbi:MAG: GMC family oxidoreductase [Thiohalomonadales bacterium]